MSSEENKLAAAETAMLRRHEAQLKAMTQQHEQQIEALQRQQTALLDSVRRQHEMELRVLVERQKVGSTVQ